jgi:putative spermidine/putrescine transport system permease protein
LTTSATRSNGAPRDIYFRPRTRFVADFIGAANLHRGKLSAGAMSTPFGMLRCCHEDGQDVEICWRPEAARLGGDLSGTVKAVAFQGAHVDVFVAAGTETVRLQVPGHYESRSATGWDSAFHPRASLRSRQGTMRNVLRIGLLLAPGVGVVLAFMGAVLYRAVAQAFGLYDFSGTSEGLSLTHWQEVLATKRFWRAFQWSAYIAASSAVISVALAYPIALWLRKPFRGSMALSAMLKAPLLVPGLVAAFLLVNVISYHGFVNEFLVWVGFWEEPRRMQNDANGFAVIGLQVWKQMPFAFLLLSGAVQAIPDPVLNAAQDLGAGTFARFRKVIAIPGKLINFVVG